MTHVHSSILTVSDVNAVSTWHTDLLTERLLLVSTKPSQYPLSVSGVELPVLALIILVEIGRRGLGKHQENTTLLGRTW